jgi:hypothetical protein
MIIRSRFEASPYPESRRLAPILIERRPNPMMKVSEGLASKGIERILELSADAHIRRRGTVRDSPEFHNLTGAIAAYGKALELLTAMHELEEFYAMIDLLDVPAGAQPVC